MDTFLSQEKVQRWIDDEEECDARGEEARDRVVDIEPIELCRGDGVDRTRRHGEYEDGTEENRIADEWIADYHHKGRQDEKTQREEVERISCIAARAVEVDERTDGKHPEPCAEVDKSLEYVPEDGRTRDASSVQREPCRHTDDAELVPGEEDAEEMHLYLAGLAVIFVLQVIILCHGEDSEDEHERLKDAHDLCVRKALLTVEDEGADAAEGRNVRHHRVREERAAVERAVIAPNEKCLADECGEEDDENPVDRDECEIP